LNVTVAGASGFIGKKLINKILLKFKVKGLSRSNKTTDSGINWVKTDLFSFSSTKKALEDTNVAIYLVHSMLPSSRLFQGNFQDTDLLLADNFAKACIKNKVEQIIYLGGLVPSSGSSKHLDSRKEVEDVLKATGIPVTILRAGMVVGDGGSSFEILRNLVLNLPGMLLPRWTESNTQTIYIDDLTAVISDSIANDKYKNKTFDVVNGEKITYAKLIKQTSKYLGTNIKMIPVPINYTSFSKLWVKIFGQADYELVSPLIDSLLCDLPSPSIPNELKPHIVFKSYQSMLENISKIKKKKTPKKRICEVNNVRSIQRLPNPSHLNQEEISNEYVSWLGKFMKFLVRAVQTENYLRFYFIGIKKPLLILKKMDDKENLNRMKFHITGGLLSKSKKSGTLEFRIVGNGLYTLASINEFIPSLPWYIYKFTQAPMHAFVMKAFGKHLNEKVK
jgi:nucleoside-diphosphate-sugar epimerase